MSATDTEQDLVDDETNPRERQGDYGGDEETTLPPPPPYEPGPAGPAKPFAFGDFRTYETTFAAIGDGALLQVELSLQAGRLRSFHDGPSASGGCRPRA